MIDDQAKQLFWNSCPVSNDTFIFTKEIKM